MRTVLLALLHRRPGISFQLKTARYEVIGTMTLNPKTSQHEMEISEDDYLKHAKELARLCQQATTAVYVVEFREKTEAFLHVGINPDGGMLISDNPITADDHVPLNGVIPTFGTPRGPLGIDTTLKFNQLVKAAKSAGVPLKKGGSREDALHAIAEYAAGQLVA